MSQEFEKLNELLSSEGCRVTVRRVSQHVALGQRAHTIEAYIKLRGGAFYGSCTLRYDGDLPTEEQPRLTPPAKMTDYIEAKKVLRLPTPGKADEPEDAS